MPAVNSLTVDIAYWHFSDLTISADASPIPVTQELVAPEDRAGRTGVLMAMCPSLKPDSALALRTTPFSRKHQMDLFCEGELCVFANRRFGREQLVFRPVSLRYALPGRLDIPAEVKSRD
jgi:hypothetical protein